MLNPTIQYLKKNYSLDVYKISKIKHTDVNSKNFLAVSKNGSYVVHSFANYKTKRMEQICKILDFCAKNKANVSEPILGNNRSFVDSKRRLYVTRFHDGKFFSIHTQLDDLAKNLAYIHKTLKKIRISLDHDDSQKYYAMLTDKEFEVIKNLSNKKSQTYDRIIYKNIDFLSSITKYLQTSNYNKKYTQLIHSDLHPKNVLFQNNKLEVILDFGAMRKGSVIEDIAFSSFRFSLYQKKETKIRLSMKKFLKNYLTLNKSAIEFTDEEYFLKKIILERINYILRNRYFYDSNLWVVDIQKHLAALKLADSIFK